MNFIASQTLLIYILKVFGFFGYRPDQFGLHGNFLDIIYNLIVTFSFQYFFINSENAAKMRENDKSKGNISNLIDLLNFLSNVAFMFLINISMIIKKNSQIKFFEKIKKIEMKIDPNGSSTFNHFLQRKSFLYIARTLIKIGILPVVCFVYFNNSLDQILTTLGNNLFMASFICFIWSFLIILMNRLIALISNLNDGLENNEKCSNEKLEDTILSYNDLCDITRSFNDEFGIACLVSYLMVFVSISISSYNFLADFIELDQTQNHPNLMLRFLKMMWTFVLTTIFLEFSFQCEILNKEV